LRRPKHSITEVVEPEEEAEDKREILQLSLEYDVNVWI
jgi:hypothetical protein